MAVRALGLKILMNPVFLNLNYGEIANEKSNDDGLHLESHLSRVLRACDVILAENNKDVFVNNASES